MKDSLAAPNVKLQCISSLFLICPLKHLARLFFSYYLYIITVTTWLISQWMLSPWFFFSIIFYILQAHIKNCTWSNHLSIFGCLVIKVLMSMGHFIKKIHHACNLFKTRKIELLFWFHWQAMDSCLIQVLQGTVEQRLCAHNNDNNYILYVYILYCMSLNLE